MNILSVCRDLPTEQHPVRGLFVHRRLEELSKHVNLRALIPQPWFPILRSKTYDPPLQPSGIEVDTAPMFYLPKVAKKYDADHMRRCVGRWIDSMDPCFVEDSVLDAHFGYPEGVGCYLAAEERGLPVFITIRGLEIDLLRLPHRKRQIVHALDNAAGVIAVSDSLRRAVVKAGVRETQISVIPNGVDATIYYPGDKKTAREIVGFDDNAKLLLSVGTLKRVKGHDVLLRAMGQLASETKIQLVCIGARVDASWAHELHRIAEELGISKQVHFVGAKSRTEVAQWLRSCDLFVLASHREGCCNAVLEALATGVPVVATRAGDNERYVVDGVTGQLAPTNNPIALSQAIRLALHDKYDSSQVANSVKNCTWERVAMSAHRFMAEKTGRVKQGCGE